MPVKKGIALFLLLVVMQLSAFCQAKADEIVGYWQTSGKNPAKIQIYKTGDRYNGKIVWLKQPTENGVPKTDKKNPDKARQLRPIIGTEILSSFHFDGDDEWEDGKIYDPESGKTYSCYISLKDRSMLEKLIFL
jgi:uncharacterized protein (DUF2147 family)